MINLKVIKNNKVIYNGNVIKVLVSAENLGIVEFQQGCANAIYKIYGDVMYTTEQNKKQIININDGVINVSPDHIEVIE